MRDAEWIRYSEFRIPNSEFRMKGVILAGGLGKRLEPLTRITNKHLLPVYDRPMIYFPVQTLVDAGLTEIMLVVGGNHAGEFLRLLGNGAELPAASQLHLPARRGRDCGRAASDRALRRRGQDGGDLGRQHSGTEHPPLGRALCGPTLRRAPPAQRGRGSRAVWRGGGARGEDRGD